MRLSRYYKREDHIPDTEPRWAQIRGVFRSWPTCEEVTVYTRGGQHFGPLRDPRRHEVIIIEGRPEELRPSTHLLGIAGEE